MLTCRVDRTCRGVRSSPAEHRKRIRTRPVRASRPAIDDKWSERPTDDFDDDGENDDGQRLAGPNDLSPRPR